MMHNRQQNRSPKRRPNRRTRRPGGFTLVELMIAVAVIGILASIAVPTYRDYTIRAKISEALNMAASAKISIAEYYISEGELPSNLEEAGMENISTDYIASIGYAEENDSAQITITLATGIGGDAGGKKVVVAAAPAHGGAILEWSCNPAAEDGVDKKYLPATCR